MSRPSHFSLICHFNTDIGEDYTLWTFRFRKKQKISWPAEWISASYRHNGSHWPHDWNLGNHSMHELAEKYGQPWMISTYRTTRLYRTLRVSHSRASRRPSTTAARVWSQVNWDLWLIKWHWGKISPSTQVSPANFHSTNCSTLINHPISRRNYVMVVT
jgi:hypothetical protein